jgi:hypothetical protein
VNTATKITELPALTADLLQSNSFGCCVNLAFFEPRNFSKILLQLQQQRDLLKVSYDPLTTDLHKVIADTSDPVWPAEIRASWPLFMMGASQMWLAQIEMIKQGTPEEKGMAQRYKSIQEQITELWQQQGQHALMHHLSALYAYQPVAIRF